MPSPHFDAKVISRAKGQSAVASAAYRAGEKLHDERLNKTFDYTRKEKVVYKEIMTPENAPAWAKDRETLWNKVEQSENRKDAQLTRDLIVAIPRELPSEQQIALVREFVQENFVNHGMIADVCIHENRTADGGKNPHAHIMLTLRELDGDGFGKKNREWNQKDVLLKWRNEWEKTVNKHLEQAGRPERVSLQARSQPEQTKEPEVQPDRKGAKKPKKEHLSKGDYYRKLRHETKVREAMQGLRSRLSPKGKKVRKLEQNRLQSLGKVATDLNQSDDGDPRTKAKDERQAFEREAKAALRGNAKRLDKRMMKAMRHSYKQRAERRQLDAAGARYSLHKSSKELSEELENRDHDR